MGYNIFFINHKDKAFYDKMCNYYMEKQLDKKIISNLAEYKND